MSASAQIEVFWVYEGAPGTVLCYVTGHDGAVITQASTSSIAYSVVDVRRPNTVVASGTIVVADTVFDSLQTSDARWTVDDTGFNFAWAQPAAIVPDGGKTYQVEITFTPATGSAIPYPYRLKTHEIYSG